MARIRVVREIAKGGFGVIHEVEVNGQHFARKTFDEALFPQLSADQKAKARLRFTREVTIQSRLNHPHIVPIVESDLTGSRPWFLMPLATESYFDKINRDAPTRTVDLDPLLQVLSALEELHRLGYVHRDLKPKNILFVDGRWMLSDLGLILPIADHTTTLTGVGSAYGTINYASPEQASNFHSAPTQADSFAFGCILHDLAGDTVRIPFSKATAPGPIGPIIERCTEPDPDDRFPDVAALRSALVAILSAPSTTQPEAQTTKWLDQLRSDPQSLTKEDWREVMRIIDRDPGEQGTLLLEAIDLPQLEAASQVSPGALPQLAVHVCGWARNGGFDFAYCDVLAARLQKIYDLGGTREKAEATMAAMELGCSHNRWLVMRTFMRMAGKNIDDDLADRLVVEVYSYGPVISNRVNQIEGQINTTRNSLHPKVRDAINELDPAPQ